MAECRRNEKPRIENWELYESQVGLKHQRRENIN